MEDGGTVGVQKTDTPDEVPVLVLQVTQNRPEYSKRIAIENAGRSQRIDECLSRPI